MCADTLSLLGGGDASASVVDEFLAFSLACLALPKARSAMWIVAAFTLFRIIDATSFR
ncbi:phosphatidylglycerophosphatase A [Luteimonas fraxinea]|uniref:phosphatidylglycerophosphatase A n=1 Tax=Luteimonas fraxinea TaxID=2901869 RepID=UPI003CCCC9D3